MNFFFSFLFGAGIVSVASMAVSSAESRIPEVPSAPALRPVSGSIKAGYSTNYEFRGLIPAGCNPTAPLRLDWRSDLNDRYSLILALKEEIFLGHPAVDIENETMVDLGLQRKFGKATYAALSFRANDGGLAGFASERLFGNFGKKEELAGYCKLLHIFDIYLSLCGKSEKSVRFPNKPAQNPISEGSPIFSL